MCFLVVYACLPMSLAIAPERRLLVPDAHEPNHFPRDAFLFPDEPHAVNAHEAFPCRRVPAQRAREERKMRVGIIERGMAGTAQRRVRIDRVRGGEGDVNMLDVAKDPDRHRSGRAIVVLRRTQSSFFLGDRRKQIRNEH